jgi:ABC-type multidrug transport system fused ATPase/permease subunit
MPGRLDTLNNLYSLLDENERSEGAKVMLLVIGLSLIDVLGIASIMPFLAVLGDPGLINENELLNYAYQWSANIGVTDDRSFLIFLGLASFSLIVGTAAYRSYAAMVVNFFIEHRRHSISLRLLKTYSQQPYLFFVTRHTGSLSKSVLSEVDEVVGNVLYFVINMFAGLVIAITIGALLVFVNPVLALISVCLFGSVYGVVYLSLRNRATKAGDNMVVANDSRFKGIEELIGAIKPIKLSGKVDIYSKRYDEASHVFAHSLALKRTLNQLPQYLVEAVAFGGMILMSIGLLVFNSQDGSTSVGTILPTLGLYAFSAYRVQPALRSIFQGMVSLRYGRTAILSLKKDLSLSVNNLNEPHPVGVPPFCTDDNFSISVSGMTFSYKQGEAPAINDVNFSIEPGSKLAIVGRSGSGKSTLIDLLLGLLEPTAGRVSVNGKVLTRATAAEFHRFVGYVPQDIVLVDGTIQENIALGVEPSCVDLQRICWAIRAAGLNETVFTEFSKGVDTEVGQRGVRLSGGQRQRIGIARALYHNPKIIILDEATSALDTITETEVLETLKKELVDKTVITVTHRFSALRSSDRILVLEGGSLKDDGVYSDLLMRSKLFADLANQNDS